MKVIVISRVVIIAFVCLLMNDAARAGTLISSTLSCSALSTNPEKFKKFTLVLPFTLSGSSLEAHRATVNQPGTEVYSGTIRSDKNIEVTGRGSYDGEPDSWIYKFSGSIQGDLTVLYGAVDSKSGAHRNCTLTFLYNRDVLLAASQEPEGLTPNKLADMAKDLQEKQRALQIAQEELKKQQQDYTNRQKTLETSQTSLNRKQANTADSLKQVENLLGGIILPPTEDPKSWMMRVAAVPIQQQQFCRIVDRFYDKITNVYKARNDIKKNSLFRDRKEDMAALLPHGEFTNWVVQIKEVKQAPDGSVAVMLQPPCRVMLGSDACQKDGSNIRATILTSSPLYRELSKVSAGDFVVVSGKILYAETAGANQPLPTYAVYQAGSHCSAVEESKQEDVFVTEINYLVQLQ